MRAKILIIGGGVMGVSVARYAARRTDPLSDPVILVERRELGAGSSGRSGAILRQQYSDRVTAAMARDSLRKFATFRTRVGRSIGFMRTGVMTIAGPSAPEKVELLETNLAMQQTIGIDVRRLDADEMRELVPGIHVDEGSIGAFEPDGGQVDPLRTVEAFAALARNYGATTRMGIEVEELMVEGGRIVGATTSEGEFLAEQVVLAAGPWSRSLLARAGVELPLTVVCPEQHFVAMPILASEGEDDAEEVVGGDAELDTRFTPLEDVGPPPAHPILLDLEQGYYSKCEPSGLRTRIGRMETEGDRELEDPDDLDEEVDPAFSLAARDALCWRMPIYRDQQDVGAESAWYTMTPDAQAMIGPAPGIEGLFLVTGFSGHGFKLAPSIGEGVTQMLFGDPVSAFDPEFFSPQRFAEGASAKLQGPFGI